MISITGIEKTFIYKTCFLRRNIVRLLQREIERPDYTPQSSNAKNLSGLLLILNTELKHLSPTVK